MDWQNQKGVKLIREGQERGDNPKAEKAYEKRRREEQFIKNYIAREKRRTMRPHQLRDYLKGLPPRDSVRRFFRGNPAPEDIIAIGEYGRVVENFVSEKGLEITIMFIDIPRRVRKESVE